jgi:competence protein ComEA
MDVAPPTLTVTTAPAPAPAPPPPAAPAPEVRVPNIEHPTPWPRSAQRATAGLLVLAIGLLAWRLSAAGRWGTRPTTLETDSAAFRVDLNRADNARLRQLPGVGESLARRIEESRELHGEFRGVDDLRRVSGIGPATLERLRPFVYAQPTSLSDDAEDPPPLVAAPAEPKVIAPTKAAPAKKPAVSKKVESLTDRVDVNRATAEELQRLPGVGPALSGRVIAAREQKPFRAVEDLRRVHGIGPKTLERLRPHVTVGGEEKEAAR